MLCSDLLKEYIKFKDLKQDDYIFNISSTGASKYLRRLILRIFEDRVTEAGQKYSQISLYDFRHNACCYWLPRYKSESALKYRFGWKKSEEIHYYSEFLGMKDTISQEDLLIDVTKTELQKEQEKLKRENGILKEKIEFMEKDMKNIQEGVNGLYEMFEKIGLDKPNIKISFSDNKLNRNLTSMG
ncbi:MAG: hypothetical protein AABX54_03975 [Nanoarchaeota archaeon]|mgnify:FL=1